MLQHVAIEHNEEDTIINNMLLMDNENEVTDVKETKNHKESSFVWSESMLDEYL